MSNYAERANDPAVKANSEGEQAVERILAMRRAPYFVKIAKGLRLGYYRGSACGTWIGRRYRGAKSYNTTALGPADDLSDADAIKVLDFWQAQADPPMGRKAAADR